MSVCERHTDVIWRCVPCQTNHWLQRCCSEARIIHQMGVSISRGTPKCQNYPKLMVYNGNPINNEWLRGTRGTPILGNLQMDVLRHPYVRHSSLLCRGKPKWKPCPLITSKPRTHTHCHPCNISGWWQKVASTSKRQSIIDLAPEMCHIILYYPMLGMILTMSWPDLAESQ